MKSLRNILSRTAAGVSFCSLAVLAATDGFAAPRLGGKVRISPKIEFYVTQTGQLCSMTKRRKKVSAVVGTYAKGVRALSKSDLKGQRGKTRRLKAMRAQLRECVRAAKAPPAPPMRAAPCTDINGDGVNNSNDISAFLMAWVQHDPIGDFDSNGLIESIDISRFLAAWADPSLCPAPPPPTATPTPTPTPDAPPPSGDLNECNDGVDNDGDGVIDSQDTEGITEGALGASLGCLGPNQQETAVNHGFTVFTRSPDTRIVYVSSSSGNDSNDGLTEATAVRTLSRGYSLLRSGYPDWLLLKRGESHVTATLAIKKSGRSEAERMVIGAYGVGDRPRILTGSSSFITRNAGGGNGASGGSHLALVGLHITPHQRSAFDNPVGFNWVGGGQNLLIEDCHFERFGTGIVVQQDSSVQPRNVKVRRSVVSDSYTASAHSQGLYAYGVNGLLLEENVFDHNGWLANVVQANVTSATWNASTRVLRQPGAFALGGHYDPSQNVIHITEGLFDQGTVNTSGAAPTRTRIRGSSNLSAVDGYYTGKKIRFPDISGTGSYTVEAYTGATREFLLSGSGLPDPSAPGNPQLPSHGARLRIDVGGVFTVQERVDNDSIRLATADLSPVNLTFGDIKNSNSLSGTIFNHNLYLHQLSTDVVVRRNIISRASSHGAQVRPGGTVEDNFFIRNGLGMFVARAESHVRNNVFVEGKDIRPDIPRGHGLETLQVENATIEGNIFANKLPGAGDGFAMSASTTTDGPSDYVANFRNNIVYNWRGDAFQVANADSSIYSLISVTDNIFKPLHSASLMFRFMPSSVDQSRFVIAGNTYDTPSPSFRIGSSSYGFTGWVQASGDSNSAVGTVQFVDPTRSAASYDALHDGAGTFESLIARVRAQSRSNFSNAYTASAVNAYIRAGFERQ